MRTNQPMLVNLPDELLSVIFLRLTPATLVAIQKTSRRFESVAKDPHIWKYYCLSTWNYWEKHHELPIKLTLPVKAVGWKQLFVERIVTDNFVSQTLDSILSSQKDRISKAESVLEKGYDAKDFLIRHAQAPEDVSDVLARRYYSDALLGSFHRKIAAKEWQRLGDGEDVPLEKALGAFDMFISHTDIDTIGGKLDELSAQVLEQHSDLSTVDSRQGALMILSFLRERKLLGINDDTPYAALQNNLIGEALFRSNHTSLPLISAAIYCAVAQRLGIEARPCNFPLHVYVRVSITSTNGPKSKESIHHSSEDVLYLDPFRSKNEVDVKILTNELRLIGIPATMHENYIGPASTRDVVLRSTRNMMNRQRGDPASQQRRTWTRAFIDKETFDYATFWAHTQLLPLAMQNIQYHISIGQLYQEHFPLDAGIIEEYLTPFLDEQHQNFFARTTRSARTEDSASRPIMRRDSSVSAHVKYRVGQMMFHKRYSYEGVIIGWTPVCKADERWIIAQGVDRLPKGRQQSFYHVL